MATRTLSYNPQDRWTPENFERCRALRKYSKQVGKGSAGNPVALAPLKGHNLAEFGVPGATFNPDSLILPAGLSESEWMVVGQKVARIQESSAWWLADFVNYGAAAFGMRRALDLAVQATGYARSTLVVYACVGRKFPPEQRVPGLPYKRHEVVMALPEDKRQALLTEAAEIGMNAVQLADAVREIQTGLPSRFDRPNAGRRRLTIFMEPALYDELRNFSDGMGMRHLLKQIVDEWIAKQKQGAGHE